MLLWRSVATPIRYSERSYKNVLLRYVTIHCVAAKSVDIAVATEVIVDIQLNRNRLLQLLLSRLLYLLLHRTVASAVAVLVVVANEGVTVVAMATIVIVVIVKEDVSNPTSQFQWI